jgi:hypothetical protein
MAAWIPLAMAAVQAVAQKQKEKKQLPIEVAKAKYSPWTGMQPANTLTADTGATVASGGLAAAKMYQDEQQRQAYNNYMQQLLAQGGADGGRTVWSSMGNPYVQQGPPQSSGQF